MSETHENGQSEPVSMTKPGSAARAARVARAAVPNVALPRSMQGVFAAMGLIVLGSLIRMFAIGIGHTAQLTEYLVYANSKAKKPKKPYTAADIVHDIHAVRESYIVNGLLISVLVIGLAFGLRRSRTAWASRWMVVLALVLTGSLFSFIPAKHLFALANVGGVLVGIGSILTLLGLFVPTSARYIAECRELSLPPERRGQPRPKLFGPRPAGAGAAGRPGTPRGAAARSGPNNTPAARPANATAGKSKAKARSDAEAVARGAELARSRARASKSRRTDI